MTIRRLVLVLVVLLAASRAEAQFSRSNPAPGEQFHVELAAMFWTPTPELALSTGTLDALGIGRVDFVREFGITDERFRELRVTLKPARKHKLRYSTVPVEYTAQAVLTRSVRFGGLTVPVSAPATADINWTIRRYGYEWDFVAMDRGYVGVIAELKDNDVSAALTASPYGSEATQARAPIPTIGVAARGYPHRLFSVTGELTGFKVPERFKESLEGKFVDFDLYGTLSFGRNVAVQGGYRSVVADYIVDGDSGHLTLKGLYWGGMVRF